MYLAVIGVSATKIIDNLSNLSNENLSNEKRYHNHNAHTTTFDEMLTYMLFGSKHFDNSAVWKRGISRAEVPMEKVINTPNADSIQFDDMLAYLSANNGVEMPRVRRGIKSFEFPN